MTSDRFFVRLPKNIRGNNSFYKQLVLVVRYPLYATFFTVTLML